ncbi:putative tail length tape measure domain protein [Staphylococcus aureus]|nr:putative tail length tape measure domain protein [Staphylococcus aureus]
MGRAAADLGKMLLISYGGLNSMIGGINKYLKPLLIKSHQANTYIVYWYFSRKGVATDNSGALTQPTFAVLNDRGSGNAPGGGVQEVFTGLTEHSMHPKDEMWLFH